MSLHLAVTFWDYGEGAPDISLSNYGDPSWLTSHLENILDTPTYCFPPSASDLAIGGVLAAHISNVFYNLNGLVQRGVSLPTHLFNLAHSMTTLNRPGITTDAQGYTPIIASLAAILLTQATWEVSYSNTTQTVHGPIQWQTYGSGPRQGWEWASVIIFAGIMLIVLADLLFLVWKRYGEAKWTEPRVLLEMRREIVPQKVPAEERWFLRREGQDQVLLTNNVENKDFLIRGNEYKWATDVADPI